jgi:hypothetical protein
MPVTIPNATECAYVYMYVSVNMCVYVSVKLCCFVRCLSSKSEETRSDATVILKSGPRPRPHFADAAEDDPV